VAEVQYKYQMLQFTEFTALYWRLTHYYRL